MDLKFAHIADCHLGAWKPVELQELSLRSFEKCIDSCIQEKVDFVLIVGDLFDTATPSVDVLKFATTKLKELHDSGIPCYVIAGSHDFSLSGKTFLDVLENAGLFKNIGRYNESEEGIDLEICKGNNLVLAGLPGKKAGLEQELIKKIKKFDLDANCFKILALHTTITESKPKGMEFADSINADEMPKGFNYYALGHLHKKYQGKSNGESFVYPGPLFPTSFDEFEEEKNGSFCIVNVNNGQINIESKAVIVKDIQNITLDANKKIPETLTNEILTILSNLKDKIITLRIEGELLRGKASDINFLNILEVAKKNNCILLKNTNKLISPEFKTDIEIEGKDIEEIEESVINKYIQNLENKEFSDKILGLMHSLDLEKQEGETNSVFEKRISDEASQLFEVEL